MASHEPSSTSVLEPQPLQLLFSDNPTPDKEQSAHEDKDEKEDENRDENRDPDRRRSRRSNGTVSPTPPSPAPSSVKPVVPRKKARPPFRTPSSIHALQLSESASEYDGRSPPPDGSSPPLPFSSPAGRGQRRRHRHRPAPGGRASGDARDDDGGASDSTAGATAGSRGGRRRRPGRAPPGLPEEMPLVLLHVTVLPPAHAPLGADGLPCAPAGGPDPWAAGPGGEAAWAGWSAETVAAHAPPALRERMRELRARVGPAVLARGLLVPHPHGEFDVLESRVLEALGLQSGEDDDAARVLPCGHFDDGGYYYDDGDCEASEDGDSDDGADGYAAEDAPPSEPPPLIVDDDFDDDTSSGRASLSGKPTALLPLTSSPAAPRTSSMLPSVPCAPPPPAARTCPTCADHSDIHPPGRNGGTAAWELTFYAANGLMRAGAWRAAWREMERVDVEIAPRVPSPLRAELDEAEAVLRRDRARREEDRARAEREERAGEGERRRERERQELVRGFQARVDRAAARALELEAEVGALREERARWLDVLAAQQRQLGPRPPDGGGLPPRPASPPPRRAGGVDAAVEDGEEEEEHHRHHDRRPEPEPPSVPAPARRRVTFQTDPPSPPHHAHSHPPPAPKASPWPDRDRRGAGAGTGGEIPLATLLRNHVRILARERRNRRAALAALAAAVGGVLLLWGLLCGGGGAAGGAAAGAGALAAVGGGGLGGMAGGARVASAAPVAPGPAAGKIEQMVSDVGEDINRVFVAEGGYSAAQSNIRLETSSYPQPEIVVSPAE
jgi:hypothetical protein